MERHDDDGGADADPGGFRGNVRRELGRAREVAVRREMMLGEPDIAEAERLGGLGDLEPARVDLFRRTRGRRLHQQERSEVYHRLYQGSGRPGTLTRMV